MTRWASRVDSTHKPIMLAFRQLQCQVFDCSRLGGGFPDLLVRSRRRKLYLIECKTPGGKLRPDQEAFIRLFPETIVADSVDAALQAVLG